MKLPSRPLLLALCALAPAALPALEFPKYERTVSGKTVLLRMHQDRVPLVAIRVTLDLRTASSESGEYSPERAAVYLNAAKYGTVAHPGPAWLAALEGMGASVSEEVGPLSISLSTEVRATDAQAALGLLAEALFTPKFSDKDIVTTRERLAADLEGDADDPGTIASRASSLAFWGTAHPYGRHSQGTPSGMNRVGLSDVHQFRMCVAYSSTAIVTVVGELPVQSATWAELVEKARPSEEARFYGNYCIARVNDESDSAPRRSARPPARRVILIDQPDATQTHIRYVVPGIDDPFTPLTVANIPFGATFTSRLNAKLRTELGLTYGIGTRLNQLPLGSSYSVNSFTKVASTGEFLKVLFEEFERARKPGLSAEELAKGKALMIGSYPTGWERYASLAETLEEVELRKLPANYPIAMIERNQAADLKSANGALAGVLAPKRSVLVLVGPLAKLKPIAAKYGTVEVWTKAQVIEPK